MASERCVAARGAAERLGIRRKILPPSGLLPQRTPTAAFRAYFPRRARTPSAPVLGQRVFVRAGADTPPAPGGRTQQPRDDPWTRSASPASAKQRPSPTTRNLHDPSVCARPACIVPVAL